MVVPVDVGVQLDLQLVQRREALPVDELGPQYLVRRLVDSVVVRAALPREGPFDFEGSQEAVDGDVVEFAAPVGMKHLDVRQGEGRVRVEGNREAGHRGGPEACRRDGGRIL